MGKITNVILNSTNKTSGTVTNDFTYYVDWSAILKKDTKYKLKFNYMSGYNYINSFRFPFIRTNILTTNITLNTSTSYNLGNLKYIMSQSSSFSGSFIANENDNSTLYLENRPFNNNLNIQILDNITNALFYDETYTEAGAGTATQSGNILTIASISSGIITIGTVITISGVPRVVISFISGSGGVGTYQVDTALTVGTATAFSFPSNLVGNPPAPYILTLSFEEVDE